MDIVIVCILSMIIGGGIGLSLHYWYAYIRFGKLKIGDVVWNECESYPGAPIKPITITGVSKSEDGKTNKITLENGEILTFNEFHEKCYEF